MLALVFVSTVDDTERRIALNQQVERIVTELLAVTKAAIGREVSDDAEAWWMAHYRAKFYYAIDFRRRRYEHDAAALTQHAQRLGEAALAMAKQRAVITREHAALASFVLDCPARSDSLDQPIPEWYR